MRYFAGLDVSLETTSICVMGPDGAVVREGAAASDPKAVAAWLKQDRARYVRVGLEASTTAIWLYTGLAKAGIPVVCIEARHAHGVLKARLNKTDRNDARGIAELMRAGLFRAVHVKTPESRNIRALLTARRLLLFKLQDLENGISGILRSLGFNLRRPGRRVFDARVRACINQTPFVAEFISPLISARNALLDQFTALESRVAGLAGEDIVCRRLMTVPGVGPLVALTYRATIDVPERFARSRLVAAHLGLTPRTYQSGAVDRRGRITRFGDRACRSLLCNAARALLNPRCRPNPLKAWGLAIAERRGWMKAIIALARRIAGLLHRIWIDGTEYRSDLATA